MEKQEFKAKLKEEAMQFGIELLEKEQDNFYNYMKLLLDWNEKINLTAITEPKEVITKHFADSLSITLYINENDRILDIGTGAGFPGIPLKIVLEKNKSERHIRGGMATKLKYEKETQKDVG